MRKKFPILIDANASLETIFQRFKQMGYVAVINVPDGSEVIRLEYTKGKRKEFFYFHDHSINRYREKMIKIINDIDMDYYDDMPINTANIERLVMYNCYLVDDINDNHYKFLGMRKAMYNVAYSFVFSLKQQEVFILKTPKIFKGKLQELNNFITQVFNE